MPVKKNENPGKGVPTFEWEELPCELKAHGQTDCKGTMDLKEVHLKMRTRRLRFSDGPDAPLPTIYVKKTYVCNGCGHVYFAYDEATIEVGLPPFL